MSSSTFKDQVVVIADASSESGQACAQLFVSVKARVLLNYPPSTSSGRGSVKHEDGTVVTHFELDDGIEIIETVLRAHGGVHVLLYTTPAPSGGFNDTKAWNLTLQRNLKGAFKTAKAVWPVFRKQKYGRILFVDSVAAVGLVQPSALQFAYLGIVETLAREGAKYNINANVLIPQGPKYVADNPEIGRGYNNDKLGMAVKLLTKPQDTTHSGSLFVLAANTLSKMQWQRSSGVFLNPDKVFTVDALKNRWGSVHDFSEKTFPDSPMDFQAVLQQTQTLPPNDSKSITRFDGKVVIVTGGASGLGRCYSLAFAKLGASVVVNDLNDPAPVVQEISSTGGTAIGCKSSVDNAPIIVKAALDTFGRVDILINNAGFLRDKSFLKMDEGAWDAVLNVHLNGTYRMTEAVWPHFVKQRVGCIVNTTSTSGIYGFFGQANYAAAKLGIVGISEASAYEGSKHGIRVNSIAPVASTSMFMQVLKSDDKNATASFKPEYNVPIVLLLASDFIGGEKNTTTGGLFEVGCGWHGATRLRPSADYTLGQNPNTASTDVDRSVSIANASDIQGTSKPNTDWLDAISCAQRTDTGRVDYHFTSKDVILYNLSIGAQRTDLPLIYENAPKFHPLPTFGIIPFFSPETISHHSSLVPNFSMTASLLGEHYLEILHYPIPTSGHLVSTRRTIEVIDKGSAAVAITGYTTSDANSRTKLFYNEVTFFMRGSGNFGGPKSQSIRGRPSRTYSIPSRKPDHVALFKTSPEQAALYRLTGDLTPMHIDPATFEAGGHKQPILHGVCFMGIAAREVYMRYGAFRSVKARFAGTVVPGQTLRVLMWEDKSEKGLIVFKVEVVETGKVCINWGGLHLREKEAELARL